MKVVVQKARCATCEVEGKITGSIDYGYMLLVGFTHTDTRLEIEKMVHKIVGLRIFEDECGKMNRNIFDVNGSILAISQFTLYADSKKGNRPSFQDAMAYDQAQVLFEDFVGLLKQNHLQVETGVFGAMMNISFTNVGPTTILLDSKDLM